MHDFILKRKKEGEEEESRKEKKEEREKGQLHPYSIVLTNMEKEF